MVVDMNLPTFPRCLCLPSLLLLAAHSSPADNVISHDSFVEIRFDEPVVSQGMQENNFSRQAAKADQGLDLFDITGNAAYPPEARWIDQNRLRLKFAQGTPATASFRLSFRPGMAKYLSGKEMPQGTFEFQPAKIPLQARTGLQPWSGTPNGAVLVFPRRGPLQQSNRLAPEAVRYVFRDAADGSEMPGVATQAQLKHFGKDVTRYFNTKEIDWKNLAPDSPIERCVLVQPEKPLGKGGKWELVAQAPEGSGYQAGVIAKNLPPFPEELDTYVSPSLETKEGTDAYLINVTFNACISHTEAEQIFRNMEISAKGTPAAPSTDGKSKTLELDGKTLTFTFLPEEADPTPPSIYSREKQVVYTPPYTTQISIKAEGASFPLLLDLVIKQGAKAAFGLAMKSDQHHRVTLAPAWPLLGEPQVNVFSPSIVIPLRGEHQLRLACVNQSKLHVRAARLSADQFLSCYRDLSGNHTWSTRVKGKEQYLRQLLQARQHTGIPHQDSSGEKLSLPNSSPREQAVLEFLKLTERYSSFFGKEKTYEPASGNAPAFQRVEQTINLDDLVEGELKPGFYLLAVTSEPTEEVRATCRGIGAPEDLLREESWYAVQVTDLNPTPLSSGLLALHLSDGSPMQEGTLIPFIPNNNPLLSGDSRPGSPIKITHGLATSGGWQTSDGWQYALVREGEDFLVCRTNSPSDGFQKKNVLHIITDRPLYRPGDTVRLRGIMRHISPQSEISLPAQKSIELTVHRPNGEILYQTPLEINPYGAVDSCFTLPEGEEDVTGSYLVTLDGGDFSQSEHISCEISRRNAFEISQALTADNAVRPKQFTLSLKAKDYNGAPLSGGRVQLTQLGYADGFAHLAAKEVELELDAQGECTYTEQLHYDYDSWDTPHHLALSGSIRNDREEAVTFKTDGLTFYMADFQALFRKGDHLLLTKAAADEDNPALDRDQTVHIRLIAPTFKKEELPNGFTLFSTEKSCLWEGDFTVPANSAHGIETGLLEKAKAWKNSQKIAPMGRLAAEVEGRDAGGNLMRASLPLWENDQEQSIRTAGISCQEVKDGVLSAHADFRSSGKAIALLRTKKGMRSAAIDIQKGKNDIAFPLNEGEDGDMALAIVLPVKSQGQYKNMEIAEARVQCPPKDSVLEISLDPLGQPFRPGSKINLSGTVCTAEGKPAADAQVMVFAVDAGMLTLSPYQVENLASLFMNKDDRSVVYPGWRYRLTTNKTGTPLIALPLSFDPIMPGLWRQGYRLDAQGKPLLLPAYREAMSDLTGRGRKHAKRLAPQMANGLGSGSDAFASEESAQGVVNLCVVADADESEGSDDGVYGNKAFFSYAPAPEFGSSSTPTLPRLRTNFIPVAFWEPQLRTDHEGRFHTEATLPDTLTTYQLFALALGKDGAAFGNAETSFIVNQPIMLTPGTPFFMSVGDQLRLPLTITNNTDGDGTWTVRLDGSPGAQKITLKAKSTATLYFDCQATQEGERKLRWTAEGSAGQDAVEGSFTVLFPAPLLKESHHLILKQGESAPLEAARLLAPELAQSSRGKIEIELSANPLLHLQGCMELALGYPYGCTEQTASALLPWLLYDRMAPFSPKMAETSAAEARKIAATAIRALLARQQKDGGFAYWGDGRESTCWVSSHVGTILRIAQEQGYDIPESAMERLRQYLRTELEKRKQVKDDSIFLPTEQYKIGRILGDTAMIRDALRQLLHEQDETPLPPWFRTHRISASIRFIAALYENADPHQAFLEWMRASGHDYRHQTTVDSAWMLLALHEYLNRTPEQTPQAAVTLQDGQKLILSNGVTRLLPPIEGKLANLPTTLNAASGAAYITIKAQARPERTDYPGVTEKGLQITRVYEKRGEDGIWHPATEFNVGDIVRVSLTCAKADKDLEYFVLEDCLPSCMEAINPNIPSQAAGLEWEPWSRFFDHKEYLAERVRGFCTRWAGRDLLNMTYYARVKRAGVTIAPPAQAQLMYEPQTYGLSENKVITSK